MEVDVRLLVLTILSMLIKAHEGAPKVDLADKILLHCTWCLRNISTAACRVLSNGTISCIRCTAHLQDGSLCDMCGNSGMNNDNKTGLQACDTCMCNGSVDSIQVTNCNHKAGQCVTCAPRGSEKECRKCLDTGHGSESSVDNCVTGNDKVEEKEKSGFSTKEKVIVAVCSTFGAVTLFMIIFLIYRHFKSRRFSVKKPFWTVELTNRNYDDLDFSLLDPITDIPLVYRADIGEFDNDALLGSEKPQLSMEVDEATDVS